MAIPQKCMPEPHVHIQAPGITHQARIGYDYLGYNAYRQSLELKWHGIDEFPMQWPFPVTDDDRAIERRLARYVGAS